MKQDSLTHQRPLSAPAWRVTRTAADFRVKTSLDRSLLTLLNASATIVIHSAGCIEGEVLLAEAVHLQCRVSDCPAVPSPFSRLVVFLNSW
jgi:hypothetical protein